MSRHRLVLAACGLPVALVLLSIARAEFARATQPTWDLPIAGYDPRDLLRGRYLQFRFDRPRDLDACFHENCCVCPAADEPRGMAIVACDDARDTCNEQWLDASTFREPQRFYIPEVRASELERLLIESARVGTARAEFVVDHARRPQFLRLRLGSEVVEALGESYQP